MGKASAWVGAAAAALVIMLAPAAFAAGTIFVVVATLAGWITWSSLSHAERAVDDRADLVPHEPRHLPRIPDRVRHAQLPPPPRLPRIARLPPEVVLPPLAREVPGTIQAWLRPPKKGIDQ